MVSVTLEFIPPDEPDLVALRISESPSATGTFTEIERTVAIGAFPNYITRYTTALATSRTDWFAIQWENSAGVVSPLSDAVQGGTTTLVQQLLNRVLLRDPSLNAIIAGQEAEAAISEFYGVNDPFTINPATVSPKIMSGLTLLTLARAYIVRVATSSAAGVANKWTAGIVSLDTSTSSASSTSGPWANIDKLLDMANIELQRKYSVVLLLEEITVAGGFKKVVGADVSRSIIEIQ